MTWRDELKQRAKAWGRGAAKEERRALTEEREREKREAEAVENEAMRIARSKLPFRDRMARRPDREERVVCGECEGSGEQLYKLKSGSSKSKWHPRKCPECGGTGGVKVKCPACRDAWIFEAEAKAGKFCGMCEADTGSLGRDLLIVDDLVSDEKPDPEKIKEWFGETFSIPDADKKAEECGWRWRGPDGELFQCTKHKGHPFSHGTVRK